MRAPILLLGAVVAVACGAAPIAIPARSPTPLSPPEARVAWTDARDVFERRCVVCHGCYDAPCQLKLGTFEGVDRGATEAKVYDGMRLVAATPTRLGIDAVDMAGWRKRQFHPVLPEGLATDPRASVLVRMLDLKRSHPMTAATDVAATFTLDLDRKQSCTDAAGFDGYATSHPFWGMPYALPGLEPKEEASLVTWVQNGSPHDPLLPPPSPTASAIAEWETFLDEPSLERRLVSRYLYEHLFLASLYFDDGTEYFRLVRSASPTGAVNEIATRRPFDDPKVDRVYYRFVRREERPLEKTHMPYALNAARLRRVRQLFVDTPWKLDRLPSYESESSANPFRTFEAIPAESRYRFMLDEAEYTLMGFIKGPVCRGQVALNVIQDRFWVTFVNPASPWMKDEAALLRDTKENLDLPAESGSTAGPTCGSDTGATTAATSRRRTSFSRRPSPGRRTAPASR